jgi:hypothetical protein
MLYLTHQPGLPLGATAEGLVVNCGYAANGPCQRDLMEAAA